MSSSFPSPAEVEEIFLRPVSEDEEKQWQAFVKGLNQ